MMTPWPQRGKETGQRVSVIGGLQWIWPYGLSLLEMLRWSRSHSGPVGGVALLIILKQSAGHSAVNAESSLTVREFSWNNNPAETRIPDTIANVV